MRKLVLGFIFCSLLLASCKKEDLKADNGNAGGNPDGLADNTFKTIQPDGKETLYTINKVTVGDNWNANRIGNEYSIRGTQVTPATDSPTLSVYFSAENPADGQYLPHSDYSIYVTPEGQATISFSKGTFHYYPAPENTAKINLTTVNGKRKITFQNLQIFASTYGSGRLPNGTKITGVIVEP
jgi:hypothetical protein